jgi:hypothetical protein
MVYYYILPQWRRFIGPEDAIGMYLLAPMQSKKETSQTF